MDWNGWMTARCDKRENKREKTPHVMINGDKKNIRGNAMVRGGVKTIRRKAFHKIKFLQKNNFREKVKQYMKQHVGDR